jgi:hypothetical protein
MSYVIDYCIFREMIKIVNRKPGMAKTASAEMLDFSITGFFSVFFDQNYKKNVVIQLFVCSFSDRI